MLHTDHGSLKWPHFLNEPEGQLARWLEHLQEYNFDIQHWEGSNHQNANALSQHPANQPNSSALVSDLNAVHTMQNGSSYILSSVTTEPFPELCTYVNTQSQICGSYNRKMTQMVCCLRLWNTDSDHFLVKLRERVGNFNYYSKSESNYMLMKDYYSAIMKTVRERSNGLSWCSQDSKF